MRKSFNVVVDSLQQVKGQYLALEHALQEISKELKMEPLNVNAYFPIATFYRQIGSISVRTQEKAQSYEIVATVTINRSIRFDIVNTRTETSISQKYHQSSTTSNLLNTLMII